jgi:tetratricopeptide (TPR) repeat protein
LSESNLKSIKAGEELALYYQKGEACLLEGKLWFAGECFANALKGYQQLSDKTAMGRCLLKLGRVLELLGEYNKAVTTYVESRMICLELNDPLGVARSKAFLGNVFWAKGDYENAKMLLTEVRTYFKDAGYLPGLAWVNDLMGNLFLAEGKDVEAEKCYHAAWATAEIVGKNPEGEAWNEYHLAAVELFRGLWGPAKKGFLKALKLFIEIGDVLGQVSTLTHLGEIDCLDKNLKTAEKYILQSLKLVIPTQCKPLLADALTGLARLMKSKGEEGKAAQILNSALSDPTCRRQTRDDMVPLSELLKAHFTQQELESGLHWANDYSLEIVASSWLKSFGSKPEKKGSFRNKPKHPDSARFDPQK